jgi:hypothetical protein
MQQKQHLVIGKVLEHQVIQKLPQEVIQKLESGGGGYLLHHLQTIRHPNNQQHQAPIIEEHRTIKQASEILYLGCDVNIQMLNHHPNHNQMQLGGGEEIRQKKLHLLVLVG